MSAFSKKVMYGIEAIKTLIKNIIDTYHNIDLSAHKKFNHHLHIVKPDKDSTYTDTSVWEPKLIFEIPDYQGSLNEVKVSNQEGTTQVQYGGIKSVTKNGERNLFVQDWNGVYSTTEFPYGGIRYNHRISVPGGDTDQMMYNISIRILDPNIETETSKHPYSGEMNIYVPSLVIHGRGSETSFDTNKYREPRLVIRNDVFKCNSTVQNTAIGHIYFNDANGSEVAGFGVDKYLVVDGNNNVSAYRHQCAFNFRSHKGTSYTPMFFRVDTSTSSVDTLSTTIATNTFITGGLNVQNNATIQKASEPSLYIKQTATAYTDVATNINCGAIVYLDRNGNGTMAIQHDFKRTPSSSYTSELYFTSLGYSPSHNRHELAINALHISVTTTGDTYPPTTHIEAEASYTPSLNQDLATKKYVDAKHSDASSSITEIAYNGDDLYRKVVVRSNLKYGYNGCYDRDWVPIQSTGETETPSSFSTTYLSTMERAYGWKITFTDLAGITTDTTQRSTWLAYCLIASKSPEVLIPIFSVSRGNNNTTKIYVSNKDTELSSAVKYRHLVFYKTCKIELMNNTNTTMPRLLRASLVEQLMGTSSNIESFTSEHLKYVPPILLASPSQGIDTLVKAHFIVKKGDQLFVPQDIHYVSVTPCEKLARSMITE